MEFYDKSKLAHTRIFKVSTELPETWNLKGTRYLIENKYKNIEKNMIWAQIFIKFLPTVKFIFQ